MLAALLASSTFALAQQAHPVPGATALYRDLRTATLDPQKVFQVREASIVREDIRITLEDGTLAFTRAVDGRITGAFFEGEGEILLAPPVPVERASLALFTGSAILNEGFTTAFFRFNDDVLAELEPWLRPLEDADFVARWDPAVSTLAEGDALRLLASVLNHGGSGDRFLHARLSGERLGTFDVYFDTTFQEEISVGQASYLEGSTFYDLWTSFPMRSRRPRRGVSGSALLAAVDKREDFVRLQRYEVRARVSPPTQLDAETTVEMQVNGGGHRLFAFELSRYLQVKSISADGVPLEVIQNEALAGSELSRRGNDMLAVVFPAPVPPGAKVKLHFVYGGPVLSDAGGGLLYVGARGTWYPNRGMAMANFDLEFRYPSGWMLVATGVRRSHETEAGGEQVGRWVSERPIPLAGFNLGQYISSSVRAGDVVVESYAARGVESAFPVGNTVVIERANPRNPRIPSLRVVPNEPPDPSRYAQLAAQRSAKTVEFLSKRIGPFPYSYLALTQKPGASSQGWPGLVFLSSFAFLPPELLERRADEYDRLLFTRVMLEHETAHQWWGDAVTWHTYRDQWIVEALANYCALLQLEHEDSATFERLMQSFRAKLLEKGRFGELVHEAGGVTLGTRLHSSRFPAGYDVIAYGRGTWLFHMLRHMLRDAASAGPKRAAADPDALFFSVLRSLQQKFQSRSLSTREVQEAFEEALPPALHFEGQRSLDWFFEHWVEGTAMPQLSLARVKLAARGPQVVATGVIRQEHGPELLVTSVPVYAGAPNREPVLLGRVFADGAETTFRFIVPRGTKRLLLDPYRTVLTRGD